jgi:hypothetical protein
MRRITTGTMAAAVALALTAGGVSMLWADIATPRPHWTTIRMESEAVNIKLGEKKVQVEAIFHLYNDGKDCTERAGYPLGQFEEALNDFAVLVDDEAVKDIKTVPGEVQSNGPMAPRGRDDGSYRFTGPYKQWKVWDLTMKANQQRTVKITYWVAPAQLKDAASGAVLFYSYTLRTGATWKGKIDQAVIRVALDGVKAGQIIRQAPAGFELAKDGKGTTWTMKDFKPTDNIEITYRPSQPAQTALVAGK